VLKQETYRIQLNAILVEWGLEESVRRVCAASYMRIHLKLIEYELLTFSYTITS
jgi:hypothetical protein